ncbi:MAG TPA: HAMP domain-containing sensor histidine kinase [Saprospiraceae bacterium]|nr:HAMP domain-containing sensor histidine kinase [Saprospiraceae bacterium]
MAFERFEWKIIRRVVILLVTALAFTWLLVNSYYIYMLIPGVVLGYLAYEMYVFNRKAYDEIDQYVESVHYRDFSRHFNVKEAPKELKSLREGFNEINDTIKDISLEKETHYQYLQKVLEIINTGIISYEEQGGQVIWLNETLKKMLQVPYLRTIHSLEKRNPLLYRKIIDINSGNQDIVKLSEGLKELKVLLNSTAFLLEGKKYKLVAIQNINEAIDETEANAWQKLLSVMTHEIMNSVAPIASLADTLKTRLQDATPDEMEDLGVGIETIKKRSEGLLRFAQTYRNLNKVSQPQIKAIPLGELFSTMYNLMNPTLEQKNIDLDIILKDPNLVLHADPNLIEQVIINLLLNAKDALLDKPDARIMLSAEESNNRLVLKVADNGRGIPAEVADKIFVPFFSTKTNGSGIGLSLSKQIMLMHKGNIHYASRENEGTVFELVFPKLPA